MVTIKQQLVKSTNRISKGKNLINYIVIHETDNMNPRANAQAHANLQSNGNSREASWQYQVDDKQIIQSYLDTAICWHSGGNGNRQGIAIEICVNSDGDYRKAIENAVTLVKILMARYNLNESRVVQHNFFTGKNCPRNLRSGAKGINWTQFKSKINGANNSVSDYLVLKYGDVGDRVKLYQEKLKRAGYAIEVDGSFGPAMRVVVQNFQRDYGLEIDGYLGPITQKKINEILIAMKNQEKEVDSLTNYMNEKLPSTQQKDAADLFEKAYEEGYFSVNHAPKTKDMTRRQYYDLKESLNIREKLNKKVK